MKPSRRAGPSQKEPLALRACFCYFRGVATADHTQPWKLATCQLSDPWQVAEPRQYSSSPFVNSGKAIVPTSQSCWGS